MEPTYKTSSKTRAWSLLRPYLLALLAVSAALLFRVALTSILGANRPYLTLFGGVALAVWIARWRPAVVAALAGFFAAHHFFVSSPSNAHTLPVEFAAYSVSAGLIITLGEMLHRSRERLERSLLEVRRSEATERQQKEQLRVTLTSIGDAVITTDASGRISGLNPVAEALTGWSNTEAIDRPLEEVFRIINEQTRAGVENPAVRALREGAVVGLANHTLLIRKDGDEIPIDDSAAPIREASGEIVGCVLVFRDVTRRRSAERQLFESREMLRITLASIGDGVIVTDRDGRVRSLNAEAARLTGWIEDDAVGVALGDMFRIVNEQSGEPVANPVEKVLQLGIVVGLANHTVLIARNGTRTPIDDSAAPIRDGDGPVLGAVLVFRDVTAQRAAQQAQSHLAAIVEFSGDAILTKNLDGVVKTWNKGAERLFGYSADEMIGQPITKLVPAERLHEETDILTRLRAGQASERLETVRMARSGQLLPVSISVSPLLGTEGDITGASTIMHDIADRKMAEDSLRASEQRFRDMANAAPVLIWLSGTDKLCTWFNRQWLEFVGRTMEQEIGNGWAENVHPDDFTRCLDTYVSNFDARRPFTMMYRLKRHDQEWRWVLDTGIPRHDAAGEFAGYIGSCVDVTDQRQAEDALREADRRKDEFLAVLSHELRNPLAPITMAVDLLRRNPSADAQTQTLHDVIARQAAHLARLLEDLIDVNRIRSGKIVLRKERLDLGQAVSHAVESVTPQFVSKQQKVTIDLPPKPVYVEGDSARMTQVVANILSNASKYTKPEGHIELALVVKDEQAVFSVRDSGIGIAADQIPHIFDMFTQVNPSSDYAGGGLGVGLALTRKLVELHGGVIEVQSDGPGQGSRFTVRVPAFNAPTVGANSAPDKISSSTARHRVLVADDNIDSAEMLAEAVSQMGHEVTIAHDGVATVAAASSFRPHVALLDIGMPRMNGYDVGRKLRSDFGDAITLVAITGWGQEADRRLASEASFNHHLTKPVNLKTLETLLRSVTKAADQ